MSDTKALGFDLSHDCVNFKSQWPLLPFIKVRNYVIKHGAHTLERLGDITTVIRQLLSPHTQVLSPFESSLGRTGSLYKGCQCLGSRDVSGPGGHWKYRAFMPEFLPCEWEDSHWTGSASSEFILTSCFSIPGSWDLAPLAVDSEASPGPLTWFTRESQGCCELQAASLWSHVVERGCGVAWRPDSSSRPSTFTLQHECSIPGMQTVCAITVNLQEVAGT